MPGVVLLIQLRHVDSEAAMARELDRDVARRAGHEHERRIRSVRPSLWANNHVVITVADWDGKPIQDPVHTGVKWSRDSLIELLVGELGPRSRSCP